MSSSTWVCVCARVHVRVHVHTHTQVCVSVCGQAHTRLLLQDIKIFSGGMEGENTKGREFSRSFHLGTSPTSRESCQPL